MILDIVEEHLDDAGFLFERREGAFDALDLCGSDLLELDERLKASLSGLLIDTELAWSLAHKSLTHSPGSAFVATVLALDRGTEQALGEVESALMDAGPDIERGVIGACCLSESAGTVDILVRWARHADSQMRSVALAGLTFRRITTGDLIEEALSSSCRALRIRGLRAAGCMRSAALLAGVEEAAGSEDGGMQATALKSVALLESERARQRCLSVLGEGGKAARTAVELLGVIGREEDTETLEHVLDVEERPLARAALLALGGLGYADSVPRLIGHLDHEELSGVAGVALQRILGKDCPWDALESSVTRDGDDEREWSPDDDLPGYSRPRVAEWWEDNRDRFAANTRFRLARRLESGRPHPTTPLALVEHDALEYALANPGEPLPETRGWSR